MNISRRIAALRREIEYRRNELERIEILRVRNEPTIVRFPKQIANYVAETQKGILEREAEICRLERRV